MLLKNVKSYRVQEIGGKIHLVNLHLNENLYAAKIATRIFYFPLKGNAVIGIILDIFITMDFARKRKTFMGTQ